MKYLELKDGKSKFLVYYEEEDEEIKYDPEGENTN